MYVHCTSNYKKKIYKYLSGIHVDCTITILCYNVQMRIEGGGATGPRPGMHAKLSLYTLLKKIKGTF